MDDTPPSPEIDPFEDDGQDGVRFFTGVYNAIRITAGVAVIVWAAHRFLVA